MDMELCTDVVNNDTDEVEGRKRQYAACLDDIIVLGDDMAKICAEGEGCNRTRGEGLKGHEEMRPNSVSEGDGKPAKIGPCTGICGPPKNIPSGG